MFKKKRNDNVVNTNETFTATQRRTRQGRFSTGKQSGSIYETKTSLRANKNLYHIVVLPEKPEYYVENMEDPEELEEIYEWWAENTIDFLNEVQLIWGVLTAENAEWGKVCDNANKITNSGYPPNITYKWKANRDTPAKVLPVDSYVEHVLFWCAGQVENEELFPTDEDVPFPQDFHKPLQKIFQRLFRVFAIIYSNESLSNRKDIEGSTLDLCFRHFCFFGWKWDFLKPQELKAIEKVTGPLKRKFQKDQKLYREKKLPMMKA